MLFFSIIDLTEKRAIQFFNLHSYLNLIFMLYLKELISLTTYLYFQNEKKTVILCLPVLKHFVFLMNNFRSCLL